MPNYTLLNVGANAKTVKGDGEEFLTAILYLMPEDSICPYSRKAGCREPCLVTAGRGRMNSVSVARERKTGRFLHNKQHFMEQLYSDLTKFYKYCAARQIKPCVRLNGTSDIDWSDVILDWPDIQFYDYTKVYTRLKKNLPANYHLTLSYSGVDKQYANKIKEFANKYKANIAVVFSGEFPKTFLDRPVINGDLDDLRFLDPSPVVVGLTAKGQAKKDTTGFVVQS